MLFLADQTQPRGAELLEGGRRRRRSSSPVMRPGSQVQICTPDLVVFLALTNHRLKERLQKRAEQQGRPDDNPKAIDRRLTNFKQNTIPLVKYFQERGLIVTLDADRDEEEVFCDISTTVDNKLFPSNEPGAGPSELDLGLLGDISSLGDVACKYTELDEEEDVGFDEGAVDSYSTEHRKPKVIFMIGGPGSGKSVQCQRMEERLGLRHMTLGDLLCAELQTRSSRGRHLQDVLERGEQLPKDVLLELLCEAVASSGQQRQGKGLVISSFPRDLRQAEEYEAKMGEPSAVLLLTCSPDTMSSRVRCRGTSGSGLHPGSEREDATHRAADSFCTHSQAVAAHYQHKRLLHTHEGQKIDTQVLVDAERSPDEVFAQILQAMDSSSSTNNRLPPPTTTTHPSTLQPGRSTSGRLTSHLHQTHTLIDLQCTRLSPPASPPCVISLSLPLDLLPPARLTLTLRNYPPPVPAVTESPPPAEVKVSVCVPALMHSNMRPIATSMQELQSSFTAFCAFSE
ncbi:unnamed protein product [Pleuronectes platessa]|uniref:Nucleoside-diphosphate kinase n=1 Tax=Pleuronectes platessa TaxID=8262 RepID=A0A9N7Y0U9_PLEPL|nr:unnamed protein product [Pleuronectes platessa]